MYAIRSYYVTEKTSTVPPPLAYDLTALQQDANNMLGYSAKQTLNVLQGLYERHKIVTYPRTDSKYLTVITSYSIHYTKLYEARIPPV